MSNKSKSYDINLQEPVVDYSFCDNSECTPSIDENEDIKIDGFTIFRFCKTCANIYRSYDEGDID